MNKFTKEIKDLYSEDDKTLMKDIIEDMPRRNGTICSSS